MSNMNTKYWWWNCIEKSDNLFKMLDKNFIYIDNIFLSM